MEIVHTQGSFWIDNNFPYNNVETSEPELLKLVEKLSRHDIIEWLMWNDQNGVYNDEDSTREFGAVMAREEGIEIMLRQVRDNRINKLSLER